MHILCIECFVIEAKLVDLIERAVYLLQLATLE